MRFPLLTIASVLLLPAVAFASAPGTFAGLVNMLVSYLNFGAVTLITLAIVIYFLGISRMLWKSGKGEIAGNMTTYIFWGVVAIFMMVSIWGIVALIQNTIFGNSGGSSSYYTSQSL